MSTTSDWNDYLMQRLSQAIQQTPKYFTAWRKGTVRLSLSDLAERLGFPPGTLTTRMWFDDAGNLAIRVYDHRSLPLIGEAELIPDVLPSDGRFQAKQTSL